MTFEPFDVIVVPFPFIDRPIVKRRPAVVLSSSHFNDSHMVSIMAMITTAAGSDWPSDVILSDWEKAGLAVPCRIRMKVFTLPDELAIRRMGQLSNADRVLVREALHRSLAAA